MSGRQLAMVLDLNKCIGCQTCTVACKTQWTNRNGREYMYWNNVETAPGKGYPKGWQESVGRIPSLQEYGVPWELDYEAALFGGRTPWLRPAGATPRWGPNWEEDEGGGRYPNSYYFYLPRICNHCTDPPCLKACPRQAIYKRPEDGIVLVDQERCRGYQECIAACPYKKVYFNPKLARSEKCLLCFPRVEKGLPPACAQQCVGRIRFVGYLDDRDGQVWKLVEKWKVALPLRADFGTRPNVYYVPPLSPPKYDGEGRPTGEPRIPVELLITLFGATVPEVLMTLAAEREKKRRGEPSELMDMLIAYRHEEMFRLER